MLQVSRLISLCMQLFYPIIFLSIFALLSFSPNRFLSLTVVFFFQIMAIGVSNGTLMTHLNTAFWPRALRSSGCMHLSSTSFFFTFKRKAGLYFWSLLISSWGLNFHALGFVLKFVVGTSWLLSIPFITTGWIAMVTGQSFVLYSRLHLMVRDERTLRYILYLILNSVFALHLHMVIFTYGSNSPNPGP